MNVKKLIVNGIVALSAMSSVLVPCMSANAQKIELSYSATNFFYYDPVYFGSYSRLNCNLGYTTITATNTDYNGSWKWVRFSERGQSGGSFYTIDSRENVGTSTSISTTNIGLPNTVARRIHKGEIHYTSDISSQVKDEFDIRIDKA